MEIEKPSSLPEEGYPHTSNANNKQLESLAYKLNQRQRPLFENKEDMGYGSY